MLLDGTLYQQRKTMKSPFQEIEKLSYVLGVFCIMKINFEII